MQKINEIIELLKKDSEGYTPKPSKSDPLDVLIATMLSQNTTDKTSYRAFMNLKNDIGNWNAVLNASLSKIQKAIKVCGLANQKAKNIKNLLAKLKKERGELSLNYIKNLSDDEIYQSLLRYNGVGMKTVSCVLAFGLGRDVFPVDTHVHRLSNRLGLAKSKTADKTFEQVEKLIPKGQKFLLHTLLIRYGRNICRARNPLCSKCILYDLCEFEGKAPLYPENEEGKIQHRKNNFKKPLSLVRKSKSRLKEPKENNFIILEHV